MVNRLYNKQVSPKGYMKGGRVKKMGGGMMMKKNMMDKPMMKKGGKIPQKHLTLNEQNKQQRLNYD
jgi:hypothetical protein